MADAGQGQGMHSRACSVLSQEQKGQDPATPTAVHPVWRRKGNCDYQPGQMLERMNTKTILKNEMKEQEWRKRGIKLIGWHGRKPVTPEVILKGVNKWKERSLSGLSCTTQNVSGLLAQKRPSLWMEDDSSSFTGTFCNVNELMDQALRTTGCQCTREERDWRTQRHLWRNLMNHWKPWPDPHRAWRAGELGTSAQELVDAAQALPDWREGVHNKKNWQHIATTCEV